MAQPGRIARFHPVTNDERLGADDAPSRERSERACTTVHIDSLVTRHSSLAPSDRWNELPARK